MLLQCVNSAATVPEQCYTVIIVPWPKAKCVKWGGEKKKKKKWKNATQDSAANAKSKRALSLLKL